MIDLAPGHKQGLILQNPVLLAAGTVGSGEAHWPELDVRALGGLVVGPITLQSRAGAPMPRHVESPGGLLVETGSQNRGLEATLRTFAPLWKRLGIPIVAQLADVRAEALSRCAARLSTVDGVVALEWRVPHGAEVATVHRGIEALARAGDLPIWVKLPLDRALELAAPAVDNGANGLVVGSPPIGAALIEGGEAWLLQGSVYGPSTFPLMLGTLARVAALALPAALIACGGIHTVEQARAALAAGARTIQLDTIAWIEPTFPAHLAAALQVA